MLAPAPRLLWMTFALAVPLMTLGGVYPPAVPLVTLCLLGFAGLTIIDARRSARLFDSVALSANPLASAYKDRPSSFDLAVHMAAVLERVQVAVDLPISFEAIQPPAEVSGTTPVTISFTPRSRGKFFIRQAHLAASSPWRLWKMRVQRAIEVTVQVFPDLGQDPASRKLFATVQQGQRVQRLIGRGREVERLRDYAPGDSFDEVYWKGTARRGHPISKVFQVERTQDIYAIVDGSRLGNRNQALERFVSASLLLAIAAEKNADNFGLLTFSQRVHDFVRASHGKGHFLRCRNAIFDLQPNTRSPDFGELFTFVNLRIRKRALLFFLTDLTDPLLAETFSRDASFIARRHVVVVNQIADAGDRPLFTGSLPESELEIQARLAGHLQWAKLRELERALSHIGIQMHLLRPDQASSQLISQYMTVKQRQLL